MAPPSKEPITANTPGANPMERTDDEQRQLDAIRDRLLRLRSFFDDHPLPQPLQPASDWLAFLADMKVG